MSWTQLFFAMVFSVGCMMAPVFGASFAFVFVPGIFVSLFSFVCSFRNMILGIKSQNWSKTKGNILSVKSQKKARMRGEVTSDVMYSQRVVEYSYTINNLHYKSSRESYYLQPNPPKYFKGQSVTVFFNPNNHQMSVLRSGWKGTKTLVGLFLLLLASIFTTLLLYIYT